MPNKNKRYLVMYEERENVWTKYVAYVDAIDEDHAKELVKTEIDAGENPCRKFETEALASTTIVCSENQFDIDLNDNCFEIPKSDFVTFFTSTIFDIARHGKDGLYALASQNFDSIEIMEMECLVIPSDTPEPDEVNIKCIIKEYIKTTYDGYAIKFINNKPIKLYRPKDEVLELSDYEIKDNEYFVCKEQMLSMFEIEESEIQVLKEKDISDYEIYDKENLKK